MYERSATFLDLSNHLNRLPSFRSITPQHQDHPHRPVRNHGQPDIEDSQVKPDSRDESNRYTDYPHTDGRRHHDEVGVAGAPEGSGQHHGQGERNLEQRDNFQKKRAQFNNRFVAGKGAKERIRKKEKHHSHDRHDDGGHAVGFPVFEFGSCVFAGADTLPHHGGGGNGEAIAGEK